MLSAAVLVAGVPSSPAAEIVTGTNRHEGQVVVFAAEGFRVEPSTIQRYDVQLRPSPEQNWEALSSVVPIKQDPAPALRGVKRDVPHFAVRFALPIPPENDTNRVGRLAGLDANVLAHNHSPGFTVLPNGDVLAIYFSAEGPRGTNERAASARFVQARLRHGAAEWDMPELFFHTRDFNDQSALLWTDGGAVHFFGGGRENPMMFKMATSRDNGATWELSFPVIATEPRDFTAQPVVNAFRDPRGAMYFAMDALEDSSFLWRSEDEGRTWHDTGGRTGGRHSTIVPLKDGRRLLSIGGKNTAVNGYTPQNVSTDWGKTWGESTATRFSPLGGNQRPMLIRLASGKLCFVSDSYHRRKEELPAGWTNGAGTFVAISEDEGTSWRVKRLPVELPHEADRARGTLGYASVAQAPNGIIHVLATMTHPCLHYEFNEAWVFSEQGEVRPDWTSPRVENFEERYPDGRLRIRWSAKVWGDGRFLLDGTHIAFHANGRKQHEAEYVAGRKVGIETFWREDGTKAWTWLHHAKKRMAVWTQFWPNGRKRLESTWNSNPRARDLDRNFAGWEAHGMATRWDPEGSVIGRYLFENGALVREEKGLARHSSP